MATKTQLIGGAFQDSEGNLLANGYLTMELSQDAQITGTGQICSGVTIQIQLDSNANVASSSSSPPASNQLVWGNDVMSPVNTFYTVRGFTASGQLAWGPNVQQVVSGSTFNTGTWVPNRVVNWTPSVQTPTLQTNGVNNGSQIKFNAVAGAAMTITDDGSGDITFTSVTPASVLSAGTATSVAGGGGAPATANLNVSTEGTVDWFAVNGGPGSTQTLFESVTPYTWKTNGASRGKFQMLAVNSGDSAGQTVLIGNQTASPLQITANAGDAARPFSANPNRNCGIAQANSGTGHTGAGCLFRMPGTGSSHTYKVYAYIPVSATFAVTAHADDGTVVDAVLTATDTGGAVWSFTFTANIPAASSITFSAITTSVPGTNGGAGIQAITVF